MIFFHLILRIVNAVVPRHNRVLWASAKGAANSENFLILRPKVLNHIVVPPNIASPKSLVTADLMPTSTLEKSGNILSMFGCLRCSNEKIEKWNNLESIIESKLFHKTPRLELFAEGCNEVSPMSSRYCVKNAFC